MCIQWLDQGFAAPIEDIRVLRGFESPPALVARSAQAHDRFHHGLLHHGLVRMLQEEAKMRACERSSRGSGTCVAKACHEAYPRLLAVNDRLKSAQWLRITSFRDVDVVQHSTIAKASQSLNFMSGMQGA